MRRPRGLSIRSCPLGDEVDPLRLPPSPFYTTRNTLTPFLFPLFFIAGYIDVRATHQNGVTVYDVMTQMYRELMKGITPRHWWNEEVGEELRAAVVRISIPLPLCPC